jgi:aminoglycoside 3-N-acetyltransferase
MINKETIYETFYNLGLSSGDVVMIHGDAGPSAQIASHNGNNKLNEFIEILVSYFANGTILVPSFTYSSTKNQPFDPLNTKSDVGLFSESFRSYAGVVRTHHPIFSFSIYGENKTRFIDATLNDCFGINTVFDEFFKANGKILCIGCSLNRATFVHYVEQSLDVSYRYLKKFQGEVVIDNVGRSIVTEYFVRDLAIDATTDLSKLRDVGMQSGVLIETSLGRFPISCISAHEFYRIAKDLYELNPYSLIKQRLINA